MSQDPVAAELLSSLGLPADASAQDVAQVRDRLQEFLATAPEELAAWGRQQIAMADTAYALLDGDQAADDVVQGSAAAHAARPGTGETEEVTDPSDPDLDLAEQFAADGPARTTAAVGSSSSLLKPLLVFAAIAVIVIAVWAIGRPSSPEQSSAVPAGHPTMPANKPSKTPVDQAKAAELRKAVEVNPKDVKSLDALADMYFYAEEFEASAMWRAKQSEAEPTSVATLIELGVVNYNANAYDKAEVAWLKASELDPKNAEVYYDLGHLFVSKNPPDMDRAETMWGKAVELDPNGEAGKAAASNLKVLRNPAHKTAFPRPTSS